MESVLHRFTGIIGLVDASLAFLNLLSSSFVAPPKNKMSTIPNRLGPEVVSISGTIKTSRSLILFTYQIQVVWALVALSTIAPELMPIGPMPRLLFCLYFLCKVVFFLCAGFMAPLAFRSLNGVGLGISLSFFSAISIEVSQGFLHNGHVFHWYELLGKLTLIFFGFAVGLDCRYQKRISLGGKEISIYH